MSEKAKRAPWATYQFPVGTLRYPWLAKPDTGRQYSKNAYTTDVVFKADSPELAEAQKLSEKIIAEVTAATIASSGKKKIVIQPILSPVVDKDTGEDTGDFFLSAKLEPTSKKGIPQKPKVYGLRNMDTAYRIDVSSVYGGSKAIVVISVAPDAHNAQGKWYIVKRLDEVAVTEIVTGGSRRDPNETRFGKLEPEADEGGEDADAPSSKSEGGDDAGDF